MILLDTHTLVWLDQGSRQLGPSVLRAIEASHRQGEVAVSAISFWEVAMLVAKQRLRLTMPVHLWRDDLLAAGLRELPVSGEIGVLGAELADFHGDPADRLIVATAIVKNQTLVTADRQILEWVGALTRRDART